MYAAVLHAFGKPPRFERFPEPTPEEGEGIVHVCAAALNAIDRWRADGRHYSSMGELPVVCGINGVGRLDGGPRVSFGGCRSPYGAMAERAVAPRAWCFPVPEGMDDVTAAAVFNPGMSAWMTFSIGAQLAGGETVLILGATGVTGKLAVQIARLLGAGRIVAAGRNQRVLEAMRDLGADATIQLDQPKQDLVEAFEREAGEDGFDVVIDYVWGPLTEALLAAIAREDLKPASSRVRLIQVGESAGPTISLPAATLRSSGLEIVGAGTGSLPSREVMADIYRQLMARVACGELRIDTEQVPLADVEDAWRRDQRDRRLVFVP